mgnify:CR=1 FL=1
MITDLINNIQNNPDWIPYGLVLIVALCLMILGLLFWYRSVPLAWAQRNNVELAQQVETLEGQATEDKQQLADLREEMVRFTALKEQWQTDHDDLVDMRHTLGQRSAEVASLKATIEHQRETDGTLKAQFTALANEVMKAQGADFKKANQDQLTQVLQPLKEHIGRFEVELREVHKTADKDRVALKTEIETLTKRSLEVSEEAHNLTQALKGDTQKQGAWGEMILASILDRSGLREGEEYETQAHHRDDEGRSLRPDVVVNLPGGRKLVIDSKVSLVAYERSVNAENEAARETAMKAHVLSVKTHIDTLSAKKYHQLDDGTVEYVIMFMPIESAFSEAVRAREDLALYATEKNVLIASPTNLMLALKTVENLWSVEKRNKNAIEIAKRAGLLYDKFDGFVEDMKKIGTQLNTVQKTHEAAVGKLTSGRGNLVWQAEDLKKLGARATKQIKIDHDGEDDLLPPPDPS